MIQFKNISDIVMVPIQIDTMISTKIRQLDNNPNNDYLIENIGQLLKFIEYMPYIYFNDNMYNKN